MPFQNFIYDLKTINNTQKYMNLNVNLHFIFHFFIHYIFLKFFFCDKSQLYN